MSFGSDFSCTDDFDARWSFLRTEAEQQTALIQSYYRRLITPRGGNPFDPSYGYALHNIIGSTRDPSQVEIDIAAELRKDERTLDCKATVTAVGETWTILVAVTPAFGATFTLTINVSQLTLELLRGQ